MRVDLRTLQPNPMRDFRVDPMDQNVVDNLKASIEEDGFWGGIICRKVPDGTLQIGAGHHRVAAALAAGYTLADVTVSEDLDDGGMIRVYARENATQRGNTGTAMAGTVASAIRFLAKAILTNTVDELRVNLRAIENLGHIRARLLGESGLGRELVQAFLEKIPSVNESMITHQLGLLKDSGHYDRIIQEVKDEIEREHQNAMARASEAQQRREEADARAREAEAKRKAASLEARATREEAERLRAKEAEQIAQAEAELAEKRRAEAEAEAAKFDTLRDTSAKALEDATRAASHKREEQFNYDGVNAIFTNTHQLNTFRELVTSPQFKSFLTFEQQPLIARRLQALAAAEGEELSGAFIRQRLTRLLLEQKDFSWSPTERRQLRQEDWNWEWQQAINEFGRHLRGLNTAGYAITQLVRRRRPAWVPAQLYQDLEHALETLTALQDRLQPDTTPPHERKAHAHLIAATEK